MGKNDGSVGGGDGATGERYFSCGPNRGVFVRAGRVEAGDWPELGLDEDGDGEGEGEGGSEMEEI